MKSNEHITMEILFTHIIQEKLGNENLSKLSDELSIPRSLLQDWVHNNRKPSLNNIEHVIKLASHLGLSLEEILIGSKVEKKIISSIKFKDEERTYQINITREN